MYGFKASRSAQLKSAHINQSIHNLFSAMNFIVYIERSDFAGSAYATQRIQLCYDLYQRRTAHHAFSTYTGMSHFSIVFLNQNVIDTCSRQHMHGKMLRIHDIRSTVHGTTDQSFGVTLVHPFTPFL